MDSLTPLIDWAKENEAILAWIGIGSLITIVISAIAVPIVVRRMPHDYFLESSPDTDTIRKAHPVLRFLFIAGKNLIGGVLVIGGILMLLTPGQGVLTILIGLLMMNFPGKRRFEIWLVSRKPIYRAINWIRKRGGEPPLELP